MRINYNVTGARRKELVAAISQELNAPTKYLGMPTAAYEVGGYHIDKIGTVTGADNTRLVVELRKTHGFTAAGAEYDEGYNSPSPEEVSENIETLKNILEEEAVMQERHEEERHTYQAELSDPDCPDRMEVFSAEDDEDALRQAYDYCEGEVVLLELFQLDDDYNTVRSVEITPRTDRLTIEVSLDGFTPEKLDNLAKLVNAKAPLLKAALGTDDLPIKQTADTLQFPWFRGESVTQGDHAEAYATLVSLLCKTATQKKRVTAKEKDAPDNPKYAMRCFLLSLGFIGDKYKKARKILLSRLEGNSSWKNGKKTEVSGDVE
jgi:hypothetical protein